MESAYVAMNSKHVGADLVLALDSAKVGDNGCHCSSTGNVSG